MNILIFGPNGSGKGTQGAVVQKKYGIPHIETGVIFRDNIKNRTELGNKAKDFIDRGELVPDAITVPMILKRLQEADCKNGWLLDGFPRNLAQAEALWKALEEAGMKLDYVIEIVLDREIAKKRIMGRRLCANDNNHPNNIYIEAIKPAEKDGKTGLPGLRLRQADRPGRRPGRSGDRQAPRDLLRHEDGDPRRRPLLQRARPGPGSRRDTRREGSLLGLARETLIMS